MDKIISDISSMHWWFGVVFVGVVINICSAYVKPALDKYIAQRSSKKRKKIEQDEENRRSLIDSLRSSQEERYTYHLESIEVRLDSIFVMALGIMLAFISKNSNIPILPELGSLISLFFMISSMRRMIKYYQMKLILNESKNISV